MLAQIADRTTVDYPWLGVNEAMEIPELARADAKLKERHEALKILVNSGLVVRQQQPARVRIVPAITAAALRHDAVVIRQEAAVDLEGTG